MSELQNLTKKQRRQMKRLEKQDEIQTVRQKQKRKTIAVWSAIFIFIILGIGGIALLVAQKSNTGGQNISLPASLILAEDDWFKGEQKAKLTLVEYSDFQCPACAYFHPIIEKLAEDYKDNLKIVYRHFPLPQHKNAVLAASAAEAGGKQEKFWEMAAAIFESQNEWSETSQSEAGNIFKESAGRLNLNIEQWEKDIESEDIKKSIDDDYKNGVKFGINATPTFFLNGKKLQNPRNYEEFRKIINEELF